MGGEETMGGERGGDVFIEVPNMGGSMNTPVDLGEEGQGAHAFVMRNINGEMVDLRVYRGKVVLLVNVASFCGYTGQYEGLQALYEEYQGRGFEILGFPANNFGNQEPGSDEEIQEFCTSSYGVSFPMFTKISVKGNDIHPLYQYLTDESGQEVSWNFNKFLINVDGLYEAQYLSGTTPQSEELTSAIEALLPTP
jgi:glutathione peroxidase